MKISAVLVCMFVSSMAFAADQPKKTSPNDFTGLYVLKVQHEGCPAKLTVKPYGAASDALEFAFTNPESKQIYQHIIEYINKGDRYDVRELRDVLIETKSNAYISMNVLISRTTVVTTGLHSSRVAIIDLFVTRQGNALEYKRHDQRPSGESWMECQYELK